MTKSAEVAVTYVGTDDPFKDRIYRSGLTFVPGQTRVLPEPLAARFLRHTDVFKIGKTAEQLAAEAEAAKIAAEDAAAELARKQQEALADADRAAAEADAKRLADEAYAALQAAEIATAIQSKSTEQSDQDTALILEQQKQEQEEARAREDARHALLDQIESMDKKSLIDWAEIHYKQEIHHRTGEAKVREMVRGFVDQYGMPA